MSELGAKYNVIESKTSQLGRFCICLDTVAKNGATYPYSFVKQNNSVGILGFVDNKIILIRQYRHTVHSYEYEIPGGGVDVGEEPIDTAKREMLEETGYSIDFIENLGHYYPSPGSSNEVSYLFMARCHKVQEPRYEPLEYVNVEIVDIDEFVKMIENNTFKHSMGLVAWLKYRLGREKI